MRIISETTLRKYWQENPEAETALREWMTATRRADWANFTELKQTFGHADIFKECVIFDVGGNKYRLIAKVGYRIHAVFIRFILTHNEYSHRNGKNWKLDCE